MSLKKGDMIGIVSLCFYMIQWRPVIGMKLNSGSALSMMIIRIALAAPPFYNVLLGSAAAVFAIRFTIVNSKLFGGRQFHTH